MNMEKMNEQNTKAGGTGDDQRKQHANSFWAFAWLNGYFAQKEVVQPTLSMAQEAVGCLIQMYGAKDEEDLLKRGNKELIASYNEMKLKIMEGVSLEQ